jgi:hypothetical protein
MLNITKVTEFISIKLTPYSTESMKLEDDRATAWEHLNIYST